MGHKRFNQLEQRVGAKLRLGTLGKKEVLPYLAHRLSVAGLAPGLRFTKGSAGYFFRETSGVPRLINRIANIAVEQALQEDKGKIGIRAVKRAASKVGASLGDWGDRKEAKSRYGLSPRLAALTMIFFLAFGLYHYYYPEWGSSLFGLPGTEDKPAGPVPQYALKLGNFLLREQANELREKLAKEDFTAVVATKDFGEGWILYQVRLPGPYTPVEVQNVVDRLRGIGINGVEKILISIPP